MSEVIGGQRYEPEHLVGYLNRIDAAAGDVIEVKASCTPAARVRATLVRIRGTSTAAVTGFAERTFEGRPHQVRPGSYCEVSDFPDLADLTLGVDVLPTRLGSGLVGIIGTFDVDEGRGWGLGIEDEHLVMVVGKEQYRLPNTIRAGNWYRVAVRVRASRNVLECEQTLLGRPVTYFEADSHISFALDAVDLTGGSLLWGAFHDRNGAVSHFDGRIGGPTIRDPTTGFEVSWNLAAIKHSTVPSSISGLLAARLHQQPAQAVTGSAWDGSAHSICEWPQHYDALHFHSDDLTDAGWPTAVTLTVPEQSPSGVYGVQLSTEDHVDVIPFYVVPSPADTPVRFLASTATYTAYGNQRLDRGGFVDIASTPTPAFPGNCWAQQHPELGPSLYEFHADGSGSMYASRMKPIADWRLGCAPWGFSADAALCGWLEQLCPGYAVITDEGLDRDQHGALEGCHVLITGTHPEYVSTKMLEAVRSWLASGGRLVYLGGNGFYWRTAFGETAGNIEVRRAEDGTRPWISDAGEYWHSHTNELGGLWRRLGHPPNEVLGVGFAAQGFGRGAGYTVAEEARRNPRTAWLLEGVDSDFIGAPRTGLAGAAAQEVDRMDVRLGSPPHAVIIATADAFDSDMRQVKEEHYATGFASQNAECRSDVVFFETPAGGAVFSVGSIGWAARLDDPDICRITQNVLRRFASEERFSWPER